MGFFDPPYLDPSLGQTITTANGSPSDGSPKVATWPYQAPNITVAPGGGKTASADNLRAAWEEFLSRQNPSSMQTTQAGLQAILDQFNRDYGYNARATGTDTVDFGVPGYSSMDVLSSGNRWQWTVDDPNGGGSSDGSLSALTGIGPFNPTGSTFTPQTFTPTTFTAPTLSDLQADPGIQYGLDNRQRLLQNGYASKGTLLNGRTLQSLGQDAQDYASTKYGDVFNRALQANQTNNGYSLAGVQANNQSGLAANQNTYNQQLTTQGTNFNQLYSLATLGYDATKSSYA